MWGSVASAAGSFRRSARRPATGRKPGGSPAPPSPKSPPTVGVGRVAPPRCARTIGRPRRSIARTVSRGASVRRAGDAARGHGVARRRSKRPSRDRRSRAAGVAAGHGPARAPFRKGRWFAPPRTRWVPRRAGRLARPGRPGPRGNGYAFAQAIEAPTGPATSRSADPGVRYRIGSSASAARLRDLSITGVAAGAAANAFRRTRRSLTAEPAPHLQRHAEARSFASTRRGRRSATGAPETPAGHGPASGGSRERSLSADRAGGATGPRRDGRRRERPATG